MTSSDLRFSYMFEVGADATTLVGRVCGESAPTLGASPTLTWIPHTPEPWKLYARVRLNGTSLGLSAGLAFTIERGLLTVLRPGDAMSVAAIPSLGLSIVRRGKLIAAAGVAGALASIPLGDVNIRFPDPGDVPLPVLLGMGPRPDLYPIRPVEIAVESEGLSQYWWGRPPVGPFDVLIRRGRDGEPLLSFERKKVCPETAAHTSAELMDRHLPEILSGH